MDVFRKSDPKLQAFALIGMCNWVYKWYKPRPDSYSPEQIADYFVSLLERGYLKGDREGIPGVLKSLEGGKEKAGCGPKAPACKSKGGKEFYIRVERCMGGKRSQALHPISIDERAVSKWNTNPYQLDGGGNGTGEDDGAFWLCPYWMGRYYKFIQ